AQCSRRFRRPRRPQRRLIRHKAIADFRIEWTHQTAGLVSNTGGAANFRY
ncbi:hypothetical protein LCGC14_2349670, partial [marine sediment metagenome]